MPTYVAFMRALNVSGRFIKMAELAAHYEALGHTQVSTFINSGNVIFNSRSGAAAVQARTEAALAPLLGFSSEVFLRTPDELARIAERAAGLLVAAPEVNVVFLKAALDAAQQQALQACQSEVDTLVADGRELYWSCAVRQSESRLSNAVLERRLKLRATVRRVSTVQQLAGRWQGGSAP
ncbi:MAG: DUF1697 domain-containing protein [Rubrivivax sp.]|nr:DUF1697 domain-containing protein [Rubrivivax sp.]